MQKEKLERQLSHLKKLKNIGFEYCDPFVISQESDINMKVSSLDELKQSALSCHLCSLAKSRKNVVFGEGDKKAKLMIIGEAPGATEDEQGKPFVGRSGELLTNMIENAIGVSRESAYIANIIGVAMCRELGPLLTAIVMSGRVGASISAEIGTMNVAEELMALKTSAINPIRYLVVPRCLATLVMMPCLTLLANIVGVLGGLLIARFGRLDLACQTADDIPALLHIAFNPFKRD